jgi:hypothetical protein
MADLAITDATHIPFGFRQEGKNSEGRNSGRWLEIGYGRLNEDGSVAMLLDRMPTGGFDCKVLLLPIGAEPPLQSRMADLAITDATHTAIAFRKEGTKGLWLEIGYGRLDQNASVTILLNRMPTGPFDYKVMLLPLGAEPPLPEPEPPHPAPPPENDDDKWYR